MELNMKTVKTLAHAAPTYVVFGAAAYQSFWHSMHVAAAHGASDPWLLPISIDGVMIMGARYISHGRTKAARVMASTVAILAMLATLGVNALAAPHGDLVGLAVAVWPAAGMTMTAMLIHFAPQRVPAVKRARPSRAKNVTPIRSRKTA